MAKALGFPEGITDRGQQPRGVAFPAGVRSDGKTVNVMHMSCTFCGHGYLTPGHNIGRRRCPECQSGSSTTTRPRGSHVKRPSVVPIRLSAGDVATAIVKANGAEVPPETMAYAQSTRQGSSILGYPLTSLKPESEIFTTPESRRAGAVKDGMQVGGIIRTGSSSRPDLPSEHHIIAMDDPHGDRQKQLALDDGPATWGDRQREAAAIKIRKRYLGMRGIQAADWSGISEDAKKMWLGMVDVVVDAYRKVSGDGGLRTDI